MADVSCWPRQGYEMGRAYARQDLTALDDLTAEEPVSNYFWHNERQARQVNVSPNQSAWFDAVNNGTL
jgi:hypothetical protein